MSADRWVTVPADVDTMTARHRHLVRPGKLTSACGTTASTADTWVPNTRKTRCPQCVAKAAEEAAAHELTIRRRPRGKTPTRPTRPVYGTTGRCSCGWEGKDNNAPSQGGRAGIRSAHLYETGAETRIVN